MKKTKETIIDYINDLKSYQGYVQFSDTKIRECDIFKEFQDIKLTPTKGFIYEAHFYNGKDSITIKQVNDYWLVDEIKNTPLDDTQSYLSDIKGYKIKMAQIWEEVEDDLCEKMKVIKLQKVVFLGFEKEKEKGESK